MGIVERRTDLVVRLGETRCPIVKRAQGSRLADRAAICLAIVLEAAAWAIEGEAAAWAIEGEELAEAIEGEELAEAIDPEVSAEAIEGEELVEAQEAVGTGVHLGVDPEGSTDQAHAPTAAEVPPAWDLEVVAAAAVAAAAVAAAADGGGRHGRRT
jgi:hypothetical protein